MNHKSTSISTLRQSGLWFALLLLTNLMLLFFTWLLRPNAFGDIALLAFLWFFLILAVGLTADHRRSQKQKLALQSFINNPCDTTALALEMVCDSSFHPDIRFLLQHLQDQTAQISAAQSELCSYREMIEAWAHEIRTPLSLSTLVLDNHREEMSAYVLQRMEHVQHSISSDVEKILYYARLQAEHTDYRFDRISLKDLLEEALLPFAPLTEEQQVQVTVEVLPRLVGSHPTLPQIPTSSHTVPLQVVSDRKVLLFLLSQLLNNAFKYTAKEKGQIRITCFQENTPSAPIHLQICDNGCGVPVEDAPFIFDKGFTGSHLYLLQSLHKQAHSHLHTKGNKR